jgi:hypothetical protein
MANEGQSLLSILQQLEAGCLKFDCIINVNMEVTEAIKQELQNELEKYITLFEDYDFVEIIEKFEHSTTEHEESLLSEFSSLPNLERQIIKKVMEIVWKFGVVMKEKDSEKRKYWYEKIKEE